MYETFFACSRILKWVVEEDEIQEIAKGNVRAIIMDMTSEFRYVYFFRIQNFN